MENLNLQACNEHLVGEVELQMRLLSQTLNALQDGDFDRAYLYNNSAKRSANKIHQVIADMLDAQAEQAGCIL
jgi:hypothetical protein